MPGQKQKSSKGKKKVDDTKSDKSKSKSKDKSPSKADKKQKQPKDTKSKKQTNKSKQKSKKPLDQQSQVSSISPLGNPPADCVHHKSPFIYYCETCEELVCNQCTVYGPHNNHNTENYRCLQIESVLFILSYKIKFSRQKRQNYSSTAQEIRLEYRIQEIRFVKGIIQRDIRSEYSGILQRLKGFQGVKLAKMSHEVALVQKQIDTINDLGNQFFNLTTMDCDQTQQQKRVSKFLLKSKQMYQAIQYLINKPQRQLPVLQLEQIPKQTEANRQQLQKSLAARQLNNFKNQLLWNLQVEISNQQNYVKRQVEQQADNIIKTLSQQVQGLNGRLNKYKMSCYYCGVRSTPEAIKNNMCQKNRQGVDPQRIELAKMPQQSYNFNGRHFFSYEINGENINVNMNSLHENENENENRNNGYNNNNNNKYL